MTTIHWTSGSPMMTTLTRCVSSSLPSLRNPIRRRKTKASKLKAKGGKIKYFQALELLSEVPLGHVDLSSGLLIEGEDSLELAALSKTTDLGVTVTYDWKQGQTYKIFLADSALCSNYGQCNDTLRMTLKATSKEDYGELTVHHDLARSGAWPCVAVAEQGRKSHSRAADHSQGIGEFAAHSHREVPDATGR